MRIVERADALIVVVADGAGGLAGGVRAAELLGGHVGRRYCKTQLPILQSYQDPAMHCGSPAQQAELEVQPHTWFAKQTRPVSQSESYWQPHVWGLMLELVGGGTLRAS